MCSGAKSEHKGTLQSTYYIYLFSKPLVLNHIFKFLPWGRTHRGLSVGRRRSFVPYNYCLLQAAAAAGLYIAATTESTALSSLWSIFLQNLSGN